MANVFQPCDKGIIKKQNATYQKLMLQLYLCSAETKEGNKPMTLLESIHILHIHWRLLSIDATKSCFCHSGFSCMLRMDYFLKKIETEPTPKPVKSTCSEGDFSHVLSVMKVIMEITLNKCTY